jgi:hypothetical protein
VLCLCIALAALAAPASAVAQQQARALVSARVLEGATIRMVKPPQDVRRDSGGASYTAQLILGGPAPVSVTVAVPPRPGVSGASRPTPSHLLVRDASGVFRPLEAGGPPVLIVDAAQPNDSVPVDVHYRVDGGPRRANGEPPPLVVVYTVWYPGGP